MLSGALRALDRLGLLPQTALVLALLILSAGFCARSMGHALVVHMSVREARSVADMIELVGAWSRRHGTVAVHHRGVDPSGAGEYQERRLYAADHRQLVHLAGVRVDPFGVDRRGISALDGYYVKATGQIQRELAEIANESLASLRIRVLASAPGMADERFERRARGAIRSGGSKEFVVVQGDQLLYARSLGPEHADLVSVSVTMPTLLELLTLDAPASTWCAFAGIAAAVAANLLFVVRRVIAPLNRLAHYAEAVAHRPRSRRVPLPTLASHQAGSGNPLHRLNAAVIGLGDTVAVAGRRSR